MSGRTVPSIKDLQSRRKRQNRIRLTLIVLFALGSTLAAVGFHSAGTQNDSKMLLGTLPDYARKNPTTEEAYAFASQNQSLMKYIPCYCGCRYHGDTSLKECFVDADGSWDRHGSDCVTCVKITLDLKQYLSEGISLRQARQLIEQEYATVGPPTDTPWPPA